MSLQGHSIDNTQKEIKREKEREKSEKGRGGERRRGDQRGKEKDALTKYHHKVACPR